MEYTLHKTWDGLIITSDEEIDNGDIAFETLNKVLFTAIEEGTIYSSFFKKVIAQQNQIDFSALSEKEQKKIGWFDVENLADNYSIAVYPINGQDRDTVEWIESQKILLQTGFIEGFKKAQELLSDKVFTLEEVNYLIKRCQELHPKYWENEIQSLSQKSWKVELEMKEEVLYTEDGLDYKGGLIPKLTKGKVKITKILGNNE